MNKQVDEENKKIIISRYHWRLLTIWTNLVYTDGNPNISFGNFWHTPIAQCQNYTCNIVVFTPKGLNSNTGNKYALLKLVGRFLPYIRLQIPFKFKGLPIQYFNSLTEEEVPDRFTFTFDNMVGIIIMGNEREISPTTIKELRNIYDFKLSTEI